MQIPADVTPLMKQYYAIKQQYPHALLFFQVGDFYELFFDDAVKASAFLGIALTKRGKVNGEPIPLCGVPVHALDHYLAKLIKGGFKVALADQLEEAKPGKVVERGVTQVFTPGTLTDSRLLDEKNASYLFSFFPGAEQWGLLFAELLTAQLFATTVPADSPKALESELIRFFPDEIILPSDKKIKSYESYFKKLGYTTTVVEGPENPDFDAWMNAQLTQSAKQIDSQESLRLAVAHFYNYLRQTQQTAVEQFKTLHWYEPDDFLILDAATQKNLELVHNNDGSRKHTLFETVDGALTPMGSRMIKKWLLRPLIKKSAIEQRQQIVEHFSNNTVAIQQLEQLLSQLGDAERIVGRIALGRAPTYDYVHLKNILELLPKIFTVIISLPDAVLLRAMAQTLTGFETLYQLLNASLNDDQTKEWIIKAGFDQELDYLRELSLTGTQKIMALEAHEQKLTGINSLKIRYNNISGYYIEVTKTHADAIPQRYRRQQTLVGRERYMTPELQELQQEIMRAHSQTALAEKAIFENIKKEVHAQTGALRKLAHALANLDALFGFSRIAYGHNYVKPIFNQERAITIQEGRHPIVERVVGHAFIPNDTLLDDAHATWIITGPNMGGKSTYLRQVALMHIMAQIGCFVPARHANLPILDRIFTRIGAGDNLAQGKSTFLVEMEETAAICTQATANSLVILDEVGRGTSTYDGLAIAQAVIEYIHAAIKARCLFATHYQELTQLAATLSGIANYHAASTKTAHGIQFLHKIMPGIAQGSFGVEVAKLAQLPPAVISRAQQLLADLQSHAHVVQGAVRADENLIALEQELLLHKNKLAALQRIDYDNLSPKAAFDLLWKIKELS